MTPKLMEWSAMQDVTDKTHDFEVLLQGFVWDPSGSQGALFRCDSYDGRLQQHQVLQRGVRRARRPAIARARPREAARVADRAVQDRLERPAGAASTASASSGRATRLGCTTSSRPAMAAPTGACRSSGSRRRLRSARSARVLAMRTRALSPQSVIGPVLTRYADMTGLHPAPAVDHDPDAVRASPS